MAYLGNQKLFPTLIVTTSFGVCNIFARVSTIFATYLAEIKPETISEWVYCFITLFAFFVSFMIKEPKEESEGKAVLQMDETMDALDITSGVSE